LEDFSDNEHGEDIKKVSDAFDPYI